MDLRGYTWRKHRVWEIVCLSCPTEGVDKGFKGAALIGHHSGKDQTPARPSAKDLKIWNPKPTTAIFSPFFIIPRETRANKPKIGQIATKQKFLTCLMSNAIVKKTKMFRERKIED